MDERLEGIERRLEAAERAARGWRIASAAAGAGALLALASPAVTQGGAIRVTKVNAPFQVVDPSGRLLLMVESGRPGPYLQLYGTAGKPIVTLGTGNTGGGRLEVYDRTGKAAFTKP